MPSTPPRAEPTVAPADPNWPWIVVQARYLSRLDELQRKVQTDALGVALGVGVVGGLSLALAENAALIAVEADIAVLVVTVAVVYIVGIVVGQVRYR